MNLAPVKKMSRSELLRERSAHTAMAVHGAAIEGAVQVTLMKLSENLAAAAARFEAPVHDLPDHATPSEVSKARSRRSVRKGRLVYLPSWKDLCTGLPNALLRSALFSAEAIGSAMPAEGVAFPEREVPAYGDVSLIVHGAKLGSYDRQVFAACLDYYRELPLQKSGDRAGINVTYYEFLKNMGVTYGLGSHTALRASLKRLATLSLFVRSKGLEVQVPRLIEVAFADSDARQDGKPLGSDIIVLRVLESVAELFGPAAWTSVPHEALRSGKGLGSWLSSFYSTHNAPYGISLDKLHAQSGSPASRSVFKFKLKAALDSLMDSAVPDEFRVASYDLGSTCLTVHLARWKASKKLSENESQEPSETACPPGPPSEALSTVGRHSDATHACEPEHATLIAP